MRGFIKIGALLLLALILLPLLFATSRNGMLVLPVWLTISYFAARRVLPADRSYVAIPVALVSGQIAFRTSEAIAAGVPWTVLVAIAVSAAGVIWLTMTVSRWAAALLVVVQLVQFALIARALPQLVELFPQQNPMDVVPVLATFIVLPALSIVLLVPLIWKGEAGSGLAAIFD